MTGTMAVETPTPPACNALSSRSIWYMEFSPWPNQVGVALYDLRDVRNDAYAREARVL